MIGHCALIKDDSLWIGSQYMHAIMNDLALAVPYEYIVLPNFHTVLYPLYGTVTVGVAKEIQWVVPVNHCRFTVLAIYHVYPTAQLYATRSKVKNCQGSTLH